MSNTKEKLTAEEQLVLNENKAIKEEKLIDLSFYKTNGISYLGVLLACAFEIFFLIKILNLMPMDFIVGIFIVTNIIFLLMLFTCALQLKVYNKFWSFFSIGFGIYCLSRLAVVPLVLKPSEGVVMFAFVNIFITALMVASGIFSLIKIKKQQKFIKDGKISFIQMSK